MPRFEFELQIQAPCERVFDLSRSIELHVDSTGRSREKPVAGCTSGLIGLDEEVTWEATHFGVRQRLTSRITAFDRPSHFRDSMVHGAFRRFDHDHWFEAVDGGTLMRESFDYDAPLWVFGRIAELLFLNRYMRGFLLERARQIRTVSESDDWSRYLN
ncbi:MAG: ligand-binding SRPBCC domain-containing protein [Planctomycetota bacterium]|jgi:ligand-binding SRPBCC domain-containing protein